MKKLIFTLFIALVATLSTAQPKMQKVQILIIPDSHDALYSCGDNATAKIMVLHQGVAIQDTKVEYNISEDLMEPHKEGEIKLKDGEATLKLGTMKEPGYLRVRGYVTIDGKKYSAMSTVGFSPERLKPTVQLPKDFMEFWEKNLKTLENVSLKPRSPIIAEILPEPKMCKYTI